MRRIKIICTLGPNSYKKKILLLLKKENIDIFRINLSHTKEESIEKTIRYLKKFNLKNICIDTEGAQIRTTKTLKKHFIKSGKLIKISNYNQISTNKIINFYPSINLKKISIKNKIYIGFNNLCLEVKKKNINNNFILCKVLSGGYLESNKGVHIESDLNLNPLTDKDKKALEIAKKLKIKNFAVSFVNHQNDLDKVREIVGNKANIISKIETLNAIKNLRQISKKSNALLIDRGDLSRYIPVETIPSAQEYIVKITKKMRKPTYVATNLLETMINDSSPTRAESHDIYSSLKQGARGLVLAAETAIGIDPVNCVKFLKKCINNFKNKNIEKYIN